MWVLIRVFSAGYFTLTVQCVVFSIWHYEYARGGLLPTSSIIGPKASLSITLWPVDETSAFCTSSSFAAAAFSVNRKVNDKSSEAKQSWIWCKHPLVVISKTFCNYGEQNMIPKHAHQRQKKKKLRKTILLSPRNWPTFFKKRSLVDKTFNKYLSGYKANTFGPFVNTCCHGSNPSTEQRIEWKVVVNECVRARSCHAGGSHWMDCIVMCKKKGYYGNTDSV